MTLSVIDFVINLKIKIIKSPSFEIINPLVTRERDMINQNPI